MSTTCRRRFVALIAGAGLVAAGFGSNQVSADAEDGYHLSSTAYLDLNGNGIHDDGEPGVAGPTMISYRGVSDNNSILWDSDHDLAGTRAGNRIGGSRGSLTPIPSQTGPIIENLYGAFAFRFMPSPVGCVLGEITVTVDGEPYDPSIEDDAAYVVQEMTVPFTGDPRPTVEDDEVVYVIGVDQTELHFDVPYTCDLPETTGVVFDDSNDNGIRDEGEAPVTDAAVFLDGFAPMGLNPDLDTWGDPATVQSWFTMSPAISEDGAIEFDGSLYQTSYGIEWDPETQTADPWVSRYDMYVTVPDDCEVPASSNLTPAAEAIAAFEYSSVDRWVTGDGPWTIAGTEVPAGAYHRVVDVSWGDDINVDVALNCQRDPIVEDPIDGPDPDPAPVQDPIETDDVVPVDVVDVNPTPAPALADVRIETGESDAGDTATLVSGALVLAGAAGAAGAAAALHRRRIT